MPDLLEPVKTIKTSSESVYKEKNSVFKAEAFPAVSEEEVLSILKAVRKKYYDAVHHCYAYRLKNGSVKYSDDGEPKGTAGIRILNAIDHFGLTDLLCVVTRWFGGTKLGVGPLGKAYYSAAEGAVNSTEIIIKYPYKPYVVKAPYQFSSQLFHIFEKFKVKILNTSYEETPVYESLFPLDKDEAIRSELLGISFNNILIKENGKILFLSHYPID